MKLTKYIIGGLAALALVGCKDKMRELNTNPDTIGSTDPRYLFLGAMSDLDYDSRGAATQKWQTAINMQYFVHQDGAGSGTYCNDQAMSWSSIPATGYHYSWYKSRGYSLTSIMNYIDDNLDETEALKYQDLRAICGIVKIYESFRIFQNYGANVYSQAFKGITEGITLPEYDIFNNETYEAMDDELAGYIAVLEQPANEGTVDLGMYDPIYGYELPEGAPAAKVAPAVRGNYTEQRTLWKKFGNSYRLYMAWIMKKVDQARFDKVLSETSASGRYESAEDGAFVYLNGPSSGGGVYQTAESSDISWRYAVTDNFISYLKNLDDPRLPLLARANNLYEANTALEWIRKYYPCSLEYRQVYNVETKKWEQRNWNGVFDFETDPMLAYQGQSANPYDADKTNAGKLWGQLYFTFRFYAPGYIPGDEKHNETLFPWTVTNPNDPTDTYTIVSRADTSFQIEVCCRPQGRYYKSAGGDYGSNNDGLNGFDGTSDDRWSLYFRNPIYTYPEYCFMMAYLTLDGVNTGKSADEWYNNGVTSAMEELQGTAIRSNIQVATNLEHTHTDERYGLRYINPEIKGINDNGVYSITDKIAPYVSSVALSTFSGVEAQKAAVVGQMWIYGYTDPVKVWDWWRITGYPTIKHIESPADRPTDRLPYWMEPHASDDNETILEWPRRASLPQPDAANNDNYNATRNELMKQPNYGTTYGDNSGRIYWDTQGL